MNTYTVYSTIVYAIKLKRNLTKKRLILSKTKNSTKRIGLLWACLLKRKKRWTKISPTKVKTKTKN